MKKRNIVSVFTLVFVILGLFAACDIFDKPDADTDKPGSDTTKSGSNYTVKFEANGGSPIPKSQSIAKGGKVATPSAMSCIFRSERSSSPVNEIQQSGKIDPHLRDEIHPGERCLI
jgi:hypothetical protein